MLRIVAALLAAILLCSPANSRAEENDPKAIVVKAIKAHGGEEFLSKHKAGQLKSKGTMTLEGLGDVEFTSESAYMFPNKFKESIEMTVQGQTISVVTIANGDKCTIKANGSEVEVNDQIKSSLRDAQHMLKVGRLVALVKEKGFELSAAGEIKVDDKPAIGVRVTAKDQQEITLYFDKATSLLAKVEHKSVDPNTGKKIAEERILMEYKKNEAGIPMVKRLRVLRDGTVYMVADVTENKLLEKIDDSEFKK